MVISKLSTIKHKMKLSWITLFVFLLTSCGSTSLLIKPDSAFIVPTKTEVELLVVGQHYHDKKQYRQAISQYQLILRKNPHNAVALFELALSYYAIQDFANSLKSVTAASKFNSPFLSNSYMLMGLNYEKLVQPKQTIAVYEFAVGQFQNHIELHYQLAKAYLAQERPGEAAEILKKIISLNPYHRDSHYQLGLAYYKHDYKTPAFLSLMTFLLIEPDSKRSTIALDAIDDIFNSGVERDVKTKEIILAVNPESKTDEGDFRVVDIVMSISRIEILLSKQKYTDMQIKLEQLKSYLHALSQLKLEGDNQHFIEHHYFPFFKSLFEKNLTSALLLSTHASIKNTGRPNNLGLASNLLNNQKQIASLKELFSNFSWQKN